MVRRRPGTFTVFALTLLLLQGPLSGWAAEGEELEDFEDLDLEELLDVVYTASKHKQNISESPSAITVITREQIENTYCTDVVCLLRQVPEMDVVRVRPTGDELGGEEVRRRIFLFVRGAI